MTVQYQRHKPTTIDLFCGAGGLTEGFRQSGYQTLLGVDMNEDALQTFAANHGCPTMNADVTDISGADLCASGGFEPSDVTGVVGGPPCQDFSTQNIQESEGREALMLEFVRLVEEIDPLFFVLENVPNAQNYTEFTESIERLSERYEVTPHVYDATKYGVPQTRKRLITVGVRRPLTFDVPAPTMDEAVPIDGLLEDTDGLSNTDLPNITQKSVERIQNTAQGEPLYESYNTNRRLEYGKPAPTILANSSWKYAHPTEDRPLNNREKARIQTFPDDYVFHGGRTSVTTQIGNAVPPKLAKAIGDSISVE